MCGRFSLTKPPEEMKAVFGFENHPNLQARFNIAPSQKVAAIRLDKGGRLILSELYWGLIPNWAKDSSMASRMINARAETVAQKPSFSQSFERRRCLVPCDGFYEWRVEGEKKQAFRIGLKGGDLFAFAGIFDRWSVPEDTRHWSKGETIETLSIITTTANRKLRPIHQRMPVILPETTYKTWLDCSSTPAALGSLLRAFPDDNMAFYRVGSAVNNVANDSPEVIQQLKNPL
jgi:putative SOS response-associated peptidase YedK